jgi:hypothetical protein
MKTHVGGFRACPSASSSGAGEVAPSTEPRKWDAHEPERFEEFERRHKTELTQPERAKALAHPRHLMSQRTLTLLTATKQPEISEAFRPRRTPSRLIADRQSIGSPRWCSNTWKDSTKKRSRELRVGCTGAGTGLVQGCDSFRSS